MARHYGIGFVLEPPGHPGPTGATYVRTIAGEPLSACPAPPWPPSPRAAPPPTARPVPLASTRPTYSSITVTTHSPVASTLYVHEDAYPGWHVSVDGHPQAFSLHDGVMLKIDVPAGTHVVTLRYLPASFEWGVALAAAVALGLSTWVALDVRRRRQATREAPAAQ